MIINRFADNYVIFLRETDKKISFFYRKPPQMESGIE